ncbi:NUDIX domain-containing protein [Dactylosporangium sp. CA-139066]|uniref:NUDIX domain-containing protein n=1 Tax=Dactylosporangium sp. CA-139066 TaxID=3239930 RepID=UPI003D8B36A4
MRQFVGSRLMLMPGAQLLLIDHDQRVLLQRRSDMATWEIPAGACEIGSSFASTAVNEVAEETGLKVEERDLVPFGCLSDPEIHVVRYPNGDETHCFAMCFAATVWSGVLRVDPAEVTEAGFFDMGDLPRPMHRPTATVLDMYARYRATGLFQAR